MATTLRALLSLMTKSVDVIEENCKRTGVEFPSLDEPFSPVSEAIRSEPEVVRAIALVASAAFQMLQTVRPPHAAMILAAGSVSSATITK